jgi:hypothetical protein
LIAIVHSSNQVGKRKPTAELLYYAGYNVCMYIYILILQAEKFSNIGLQRKSLGVMKIYGPSYHGEVSLVYAAEKLSQKDYAR